MASFSGLARFYPFWARNRYDLKFLSDSDIAFIYFSKAIAFLVQILIHFIYVFVFYFDQITGLLSKLTPVSSENDIILFVYVFLQCEI